MILGEAPSKRDEETHTPFSDSSGWLLDSLLEEAGLNRGLAFTTHVCREAAPRGEADSFFALKVRERTSDHILLSGMWAGPEVRHGLSLLKAELLECRPHVVVACGNVALWALTELWGVRKWRSSVLQGRVGDHIFKVIPTLHPSAVNRQWPLRGILLHDLRRVERELGRGPIVTPPEYNFITAPTYEQATTELRRILALLDQALAPIPLAADIETRAGHTACIGFAWTRKDALTLPWMCLERKEGYWTAEQELELIALQNRILTHPKASVTWQNGAYDHQYEWRWHFIQPNLGWDTMIAHHAMFSLSPKDLGHLSSLYCDQHRYWKDDGKLWEPSMGEEQLWRYNGEDCVRTFEIREGEEAAIAELSKTWPKLPEVVAFQHRLQPAVVRMMQRGVRSDDKERARMATELMSRSAEIQTEVNNLTGCDLNIRSPKQMTEFFYGVLGQTPIYSRNPDGTRGNPTCDDDALGKIAGREPLLRPLIARIQALRSAGVFQSTFVQMPRDTDGRLRCSYNVAGTKTYRFSSSENAFGSGGNLQNIPNGDEDDLDSLILLPNIRRLFLFDPGKTGFDLDGDSADLRIVTGESGCRAMQAYFAASAKPYVEIAKEFYRDPSITKHHRSYKVMKALCHGTNYGGEAPGLAERIGLPVHDIDRMQKWYFGMCPEIKRWQEDTVDQLENRGYIENPFGYRLWRWDRMSRKLKNEALAWKPQSTVGILINKALVAIDETVPEVELLLQVHDSLVGQFDSFLGDAMKRKILAAATIPFQCTNELVTVPMGLKVSNTSWGACA